MNSVSPTFATAPQRVFNSPTAEMRNPTMLPSLPNTMTATTPTAPLSNLIAQLGIGAKNHWDGTIRYNEPLVQQIVAYREQAIPMLGLLLGNSDTGMQTLKEGLYTAEKLADARITNVAQLYPSLQRLNSHPDPSIQVHLARLYRKMDEPRVFGPLLSTLVNAASTQYPMQASPTNNVSEETGAALLSQIARRTAEETVQRLLPFLQGRVIPSPMQPPGNTLPLNRFQ